MDIKKINAALEKLKKELGDALVATDIWTTADGQDLASFKGSPKAAALFGQMVERANQALKDAGFPLLNKYSLRHLEGDYIGMTMPIGEISWGMVVDSKKIQLGILLNVIVPNTIDALKEVAAG